VLLTKAKGKGSRRRAERSEILSGVREACVLGLPPVVRRVLSKFSKSI
jgi:hypothetical protein